MTTELTLNGMDADVISIEEAPNEEHIIKLAWLRDGTRTGETLRFRLRPGEARHFNVGKRVRVGLQVWV